ncbi:phosphoribosylanthranilate isomerase [Arcticibacterium luteifluviistationis]|uniref:N-(5'-phosphoribosyl)anthranilate isomerase n=1 Tax=Arcticibacterium luteifluviistationis TaxID=1784714 RepID=A0A2Z4GHE1_9BACT|nr:phosphoribosylanthranilate isomerase [Arcticibacterium luteifluviistationis]AWW00224.1 N-(5'-phosphoribosyl)anthranilate isomerase [Arcticibacterium luteifluviistationis]
MNLKLKVCGMRDSQNIKDVLTVKPDYMGFIFFHKSPRNLAGNWSPEILQDFPNSTKKVGVFVNETLEVVIDKVKKYKLDMVQLHGSESVVYCQKLQSLKISVMKAFSVDEDFDFETVTPYQKVCTQFLFDTKAKGGYGGHGKTFDWSLLDQYTLDTPFLLAGGIDLSNMEELKNIGNPALTGIDVNSKFEIEPALKDIEKLRQLRKALDGLNSN